MAKNVKTPVMILQELIVQKGCAQPEYEVIYSVQGTHENIFHIQVVAFNVTTTGVGRSKKEAKHEAAKKALDLLAKEGIYTPDSINENNVYKKEPCSDGGTLKAPANIIPKLLELCCENKIPMAQFREISAVGPPHCREFTYECYVSSIVTRSTAGSKKHAKQLAAKEMLNRIINVIPELQMQCESNQLKLLDCDMEVLDNYNKFSFCHQTKVNYNAKVIEYDQVLTNLIEERHLNKNDILPYFSLPRTSSTLQKILDFFEMSFNIQVIQEKVPVVVVSVPTDTPLSSMGKGCSIDEATSRAVTNLLRMMETFIT